MPISQPFKSKEVHQTVCETLHRLDMPGGFTDCFLNHVKLVLDVINPEPFVDHKLFHLKPPPRSFPKCHPTSFLSRTAGTNDPIFSNGPCGPTAAKTAALLIEQPEFCIFSFASGIPISMRSWCSNT
jgi:hypothetical protein